MSRRTVSLALVAFLLVPITARPLDSWKLYKKNGRDYVSLTDIAQTYKLATASSASLGNRRVSNTRDVIAATNDSREITINGVKSWLSFPITSVHGELCISRLDVSETLEPSLCPEQCRGVAPFTTVVLDPGHGGYDLGAMSRFGCEKDYTLDLVRRIRPYLTALGLQVVLTRDADTFVPLEKRAAIANANGKAVFISVHLNATDANPKAGGFEVFALTPGEAPSSADSGEFNPPNGPAAPGEEATQASAALANCIQNSLLGHVSDYDRGIKRARYAVLRLSKVPSTLVEAGFLTDQSESTLIANNAWRAHLAHAIAMGIYNYKNIADLRRRPLTLADFRRLK